ncbi:hypothetical protein H0H81_004621, partial [Sphagnurus paluster]
MPMHKLRSADSNTTAEALSAAVFAPATDPTAPVYSLPADQPAAAAATVLTTATTPARTTTSIAAISITKPTPTTAMPDDSITTPTPPMRVECQRRLTQAPNIAAPPSSSTHKPVTTTLLLASTVVETAKPIALKSAAHTASRSTTTQAPEQGPQVTPALSQRREQATPPPATLTTPDATKPQTTTPTTPTHCTPRTATAATQMAAVPRTTTEAITPAVSQRHKQTTPTPTPTPPATSMFEEMTNPVAMKPPPPERSMPAKPAASIVQPGDPVMHKDWPAAIEGPATTSAYTTPPAPSSVGSTPVSYSSPFTATPLLVPAASSEANATVPITTPPPAAPAISSTTDAIRPASFITHKSAESAAVSTTAPVYSPPADQPVVAAPSRARPAAEALSIAAFAPVPTTPTPLIPTAPAAARTALIVAPAPDVSAGEPCRLPPAESKTTPATPTKSNAASESTITRATAAVATVGPLMCGFLLRTPTQPPPPSTEHAPYKTAPTYITTPSPAASAVEVIGPVAPGHHRHTATTPAAAAQSIDAPESTTAALSTTVLVAGPFVVHRCAPATSTAISIITPARSTFGNLAAAPSPVSVALTFNTRIPRLKSTSTRPLLSLAAT